MFKNKKVRKEDLISKLVKHFNSYMSGFSDKRKVNLIFNEFDDRARTDLVSLIKLSNERFKSVKSGNSIESVLDKTKSTVFRPTKNNTRR